MSRLNLYKFRYINKVSDIERNYIRQYASNTPSYNKNEDKLSQKLLKNDKHKNLDITISASKEIQSFLKSNNMPFKSGFTSYICSCPRHIIRQLELDQLDKLFINSTTGYSLNRINTFSIIT